MGAETQREIALELLERREKGGQFAEALLEKALQRAELRADDRRFVQELFYGVIRWELTLDWLISRKSIRPPRPVPRNLLRLALYQMFWLERVPSYAAVNETVKSCKRRGMAGEAKFVNAVLRGYGREMRSVRAALEELKRTDPALGHSHPEWLWKRWAQRWGREKAERLMEWNNSPPPTYARVNTLKTSPAELAELWGEEGVEFEAREFDWVPAGTIFQISRHPPLGRLKSFREGLFYVQDPSTMLAAGMLGAERGDAILDVCAAPGGKSTYLAQLLGNECRILAEDLDPERLKRVEENRARLGAECITTDPAGFPVEALFDRVLVDAPCSNTGVMRRRIDLRWRIRPEEVERLARTQLELLQKAAMRTRIGGALLYSTCSLEREENDAVVAEFLASGKGFELAGQRKLTPFEDGVDGAFCARFVRVA